MPIIRPEDYKVLTLHTRFSDVVYRKMELESERLGMKMSEFVRYAVITYFENPPLDTTEETQG